MAKTGRPSKYTPETVQKITAALRMASTRKAACIRAGISADTFANWLRDNEDFSDAIQDAENAADLYLLSTIVQAAPKNWRAAAWLLSRRRPNEWGARAGEGRGASASSTGAVVTSPYTALTDDERQRRITALLR